MIKVLTMKLPLLLVLLILYGCQTVAVKTVPVLEDEGEVFVYLQPSSHEVDRLSFSLTGLAALREDGVQFPMSLAMNEFIGKDMTRQRLIAAGRLPAGRYSGFLVTIKGAALKAERGEVRLIVPETPQKRDFPFKVEKKRALAITLALKYAESRPNEFTFDPMFFIASPSRPLAEVLGYVANTGRNTITVFDKMHLQATGVIATGGAPRGIALDPRLRRAYVVLSDEDIVEVLDLNDQSVIARVMLQRGDNPQEAALTPDGLTLLVADAGSDTVSVIDTLSLAEVNRISVVNTTMLPDISRTSSGRSPSSLMIDRTGRKAFVFNSLSDNISVIDISSRQTSDWQVIGTIATGPEPVRGQFNRAGDRLYVIHAGYPYLLAIDPASFTVVKRVLLGTGAISLKVDTRTDLIYIGKRNDSAVTVYDPFSFSPVDSIPTGGTTSFMTIDNETNNLYLVVPGRKVLMVVNLASRKPVAEIDINEFPAWVTVMGER
jgi:YVTN family beta-propeller protein